MNLLDVCLSGLTKFNRMYSTFLHYTFSYLNVIMIIMIWIRYFATLSFRGNCSDTSISSVLIKILHGFFYEHGPPCILSQYYTFIITCNRENQAKPCTRPSKLRSLCPLFIICYFSMHSYSLCIYVCVYMY